jgi:hypothetical protein
MDKNRMEYLEKLQKTQNKNEYQTLFQRFSGNLAKEHRNIHEVIDQMTEAVEISEEDGEVHLFHPKYLKSRTHNMIGDFYFYDKQYENASKHGGKSYKLFANQDALFLIARCMEEIKVEVKLFTSAKKIKELEDQRNSEIINAYLDTIRFDPYSDVGKEAAKRLINVHKHKFRFEEVFK